MLSLLVALALHAGFAVDADAPRLTVVISIDQFRSDLVARFADLYLPPGSSQSPGGLRWLSEKGANFINSAYDHVPTETGPGHAVIGTGSDPGVNGIVGNHWWDRKSGKDFYCVADPDAKDLATGKESMSPRNLRVSTFGDELSRATGGRSKHVSIALKDRASILMAGRLADDVIWFDNNTGTWTSSDFYEKSGKLPDWVVTLNAMKIPDKDRGKSWTTSLPAEALRRASVADKPGSPDSYGKTFPHPLKDDDAYYSNWQRTPWANDFIFTTARTAIEEVGLGRDSVPDILTLNLSTNDYVGHWFGPDSPEVMELSVATDKQLSAFFRHLNTAVPGGLKNVLIVLTADHGILPMPEELVKRGIPGGRVKYQDFYKKLKDALQKRFKRDDLIVDDSDQTIYLNPNAKPENATLDEVAAFIRDYLREIPEVYTAFTRGEVEEQKLPDTQVSAMLARSFHRQNSGDVFFFMRPGYLLDSFGTGTSHGSPWAYDTSVPLLMAGRWIKPGIHLDRCGPKDIAATISAVLGIVPPSGNVGRALAVID
ncbi:MAG: alkaline phosphatase family protein [Armatimonadetes bacterium]|nr:alkaline phosphatase family protein [Armatimonadota bacterium]